MQNSLENNNSTGSSKPHVIGSWPHGGLSKDEWEEIVALDYVLTWNYTDDLERDERRYKELSDKTWAGMANFL